MRVYEISSGTEAASIDLPDTVKEVKFSENGTWLACAVRNSSSVLIYDIRKISNGPIATLDAGGSVHTIEWDYAGQFLVAAGSKGLSVNQYSKASKEWSEVLRTTATATGVVWGKSAQSLLTSSSEGAVTVLSQ